MYEQLSLFKEEIPKMPEGYYSGDKPNPNLRAFVEEHMRENPYDPETDEYDVPAFDKPIETTKATAIYNMHTYWSKKPHDAIRQYIRHYTKAGDLVLDPMCGSGGTALAALMEGRKAIAIDRSPAATFITKNYCTPVNVNELKKAFEELKHRVKPEIDWLYETRCDRCGGKATTGYTVYSQVFQCPRCLEKVPLFDCVEMEGRTQAGKPKKLSACPHCHKRGIVEEISTRTERFGAIPVLVSYLCEGRCRPARDERRHNDREPRKREYFEKYDLGKIREIEGREIPYWYPRDRMMHAPEDQECWGVKWRAGTSNFRTVDELFTKRNLWALAIWNACATLRNDDQTRFTISSLILGHSKMCRYDERWSFPYPLMVGTYYLPQIFKEMNAFNGISSKTGKTMSNGYCNIKDVISEKTKISISTQSATDLSAVQSTSLDYIFTDPPYSDNVQYGELNFIWEAWLGFDTHWHDEEIIVNKVRGKSEEDWANMMRQAMAECHRVLKPGRWLSLCYHDTSEGTWALVQDIMAEVGFIVDKSDSALFIDTGQKSYNQLTADKVTKRDLVINFRKPKPGEVAESLHLRGDEDASTFNEKVRAIIRDYLDANPGATKDRIYDEVVSRMVRKGTMEPHNFVEILSQVAEPVKEPVSIDGNGAPAKIERTRWYLKESELSITDATESAKEDAAAQKIESFLKKRQQSHPYETGVHYSDLFEHFVYTVKDKPRRPLAEWLLDYFFKTGEGTYRIPMSEEDRRLKAEGRAKGINRRIRRYVSYIVQGIPFPEKERPSDTTLTEWIRHCKRSGLYEQGKLLYEKVGLNPDNLTEEQQIGVEEDYQTCVRHFTRSVGTGEKKKSRKARKQKTEDVLDI